MAAKTERGVYQTENGMWAYRFSILIDGKRISRKKTTDENGNKLHTRKEAEKARAAAIANARIEQQRQKPISRKTVKDVFLEYCEKGRIGKAYSTCLKQDSLWKNHLNKRFGNCFVDEIRVADIEDYLAELYYVKGLSFRYVESFLKMFYLIFGQAYSRNYLDVDTYNKLCVNKGTKIHMPKMKTEDDTDIIVFSRDELILLDNYFRGTNTETAYLLGRYCGLRINECFGLKWENVDLKNGTIKIDRQMQYQNGLIKLVPLKTKNAKRTLYMNDILKNHLTAAYNKRQSDIIEFAALRKQNSRIIEDMNGQHIPSTELVNCLYDGKIQTVNSFKYHTREIKQSLNIEFKYHYLRHTYGTFMADMNTPAHLLCNQMGHGSINVTQRYYIAVSKTGIEVLQHNINKL